MNLRWSVTARTLATGLLLACSIVAMSGAALAGPDTVCDTAASHHCYDIAELDGESTIGADLVESRMQMYPTSSTDAGRHLNSEMWYVMTDGSYIETGLRDGAEGGGVGECTCFAYEQFWAEHQVGPGYDIETRYNLGNVSPNSSISDEYNFVRRPNSPNTWLMYLNGTHRGTSTVITSWTGTTLQIGAELQNTGCYPGGFANTFDMQSEVEGQDYTWIVYGWTSYPITAACITDGIHGFNAQDLGYGGWAWNLS